MLKAIVLVFCVLATLDTAMAVRARQAKLGKVTWSFWCSPAARWTMFGCLLAQTFVAGIFAAGLVFDWMDASGR